MKWLMVLAVLAFLCPVSLRADDAAATAGADQLGWKLAVHSYTFSKFSIYDAIDKTAAAGIKYMSISGSVMLDDHGKVKGSPTTGLSDKEFAAIQAHMKEKGITPKFLNMGVVKPTGNEPECRKLFEAAKRLGIDVLVAEPEIPGVRSDDAKSHDKLMEELPKVMDVVEKLAVEFNIKVAIHEHPKPNIYWNPDTVLAAVKGRSPLIGACADVGHWKRSGLDPVECLKKLEGRVIALHFKDLVPGKEGSHGLHDVPWGTGTSNARGMLEELKRQKFHGTFCVEYEYHWENSEPEVAECAKWFYKTCDELAK